MTPGARPFGMDDRFRLRRAGGVLVLAALVASAGVPLLLGGRAAFSAILHFPAHGYAALCMAIVASCLARALKLRLLMRRLDAPAGFMRALAISLAMDFAFMVTPGGIGGYAAGVYYLRRAGTSLEGAAALTAADQGLDLLFFALALPLAGLTLYGTGLPQAWKMLALGTAALAGVLAVAALCTRRRWTSWLSATDAPGARWPFLQRHRQSLTGFLAGLRAQARLLAAGGPLFLGRVFALTALQWLTRYGVLWLALALLGHRVPFALTLSLQALLLHAAQWTGMPSGGGGAELGLSAALASRVPLADLATALLLWRIATLYAGLAAGAIAIAWLARRHGRQRPDPSALAALPAGECAR